MPRCCTWKQVAQGALDRGGIAGDGQRGGTARIGGEEVQRHAADHVGHRVGGLGDRDAVELELRVLGGLHFGHAGGAACRVVSQIAEGSRRGADDHPHHVGGAGAVGGQHQPVAAAVVDDAGGHPVIAGVDRIADAGQRSLAGGDRDRLGGLIGIGREAAAAERAEVDGQRSGADLGCGIGIGGTGGQPLRLGEGGDFEGVRSQIGRAVGAGRGDRGIAYRCRLGGKSCRVRQCLRRGLQPRHGALQAAVGGDFGLGRGLLRLQQRQRLLFHRHQLGHQAVDVQARTKPRGGQRGGRGGRRSDGDGHGRCSSGPEG